MPYSVVIVDDNQTTLEALRTTVDWEKLDLEVAGYASNGRQGREIIREFSPDIIITDIHMPEMDGLDMIECLQEELENTRIIFLTGFDKFQYASRAIKLSAFDFILKPVDNAELEASLKKAVASLEKDRNTENEKDYMHTVIHRAQLLALLTGGAHTGYGDGRFWKLFRQNPQSYFFIVVESEAGLSSPMIRRLDFIKFPEYVDVISTVIDEEVILFCGLHETELPWQAAARMVAEILIKNLMSVIVAVSELHTSKEEVYLAYQESRKALLWHDVYERHTNVEYFGKQDIDNSQHSRLRDVEQICTKMAQKADALTAEDVWESVYEKSRGKFRIIRLMLMFFCSKVIEDKMTHVQWTDSLDMAVYDITKLDSVEDARKWLNNFFEELNKIYAPANSLLVRNVLEYIKNHVTEGLVLENVASQYFVSPNYLSTLIRRETGLTYRQHIIQAKLNVAKNMLDDTRMRVEDIAYAIGYENYISFYNVFKKTEGMGPTEYRFRNRSE